MKTGIHFCIISRSFLLRMRNVSDKSCRENQNTRFVFGIFFSKILPSVRKCGKILYNWTGHRWQYGACVLHAEYVRLQTHTQVVNNHCFSTATVVARTRLNVMFYVHCMSFLVLVWALFRPECVNNAGTIEFTRVQCTIIHACYSCFVHTPLQARYL
jgi:hypothetical protein